MFYTLIVGINTRISSRYYKFEYIKLYKFMCQFLNIKQKKVNSHILNNIINVNMWYQSYLLLCRFVNLL